MKIKADRLLLIQALKKELREREEHNKIVKANASVHLENFRNAAIDTLTKAMRAVERAKKADEIADCKPSDSYGARYKWPRQESADTKSTCDIKQAIRGLELSKEISISMDETDSYLRYITVCATK